MKTIYKYPLVLSAKQTITVPEGAVFRCVGMQGEFAVLWAEVDTDANQRYRDIEIFGTGQPIPQDMGVSRQYIGTVFERSFVWHVYERTT